MIGSNIRDRSLFVAAILLILAVILIGCGGSGGGSGGTTLTTTATAGATGGSTGASTGGLAGTSILFHINWPASTRALPPYANCVVLTIQRGSNTPITQTINRVSKLAYVKNVTFANLAPGTYSVNGQAFLDNDAQGALLATFSSTVTVNSGSQADVPLTFTSTVQSIVIDGVPFEMETGVTAELSGHAVDNHGDVIFLPPGSLTWSVVTGAALVDLTPVGFLSALAPGDVTVQLSDPGSGDTAQATFTIVGAALTTTGTSGTTDSTSTATTTATTTTGADASTTATDSSTTATDSSTTATSTDSSTTATTTDTTTGTTTSSTTGSTTGTTTGTTDTGTTGSGSVGGNVGGGTSGVG